MCCSGMRPILSASIVGCAGAELCRLDRGSKSLRRERRPEDGFRGRGFVVLGVEVFGSLSWSGSEFRWWTGVRREVKMSSWPGRCDSGVSVIGGRAACSGGAGPVW